MRQVRDPAPSRLAYRLNRLMLTPRFRLFLRVGLPLLMVMAAGLWWASDQTRVQDARDRLAEIKRGVEERPEFLVHMMAVENASPEVAAEIREVLPLDFPMSSFDISVEELQEQLETLNVIESASVHIRSGGVLEVSVRERVPVILWRGPEGLVTLDRNGHPVGLVEARINRADLPLLAGQGADKAVQEAILLINVAAPFAERMRGLERIGQRRWDVVFDRDQRIMLPEESAMAALQKIVALDAAQDLMARDIAAIDFRNPRRPVLRLTNTAVEAMNDIEWSEAIYD